MDNYLPADGELARLVDETWYTVSSGPLWAFTDLTKDIHTASRPPWPMPLSPALAFLRLAFGSLAAIAQRKTTRPQ